MNSDDRLRRVREIASEVAPLRTLLPAADVNATSLFDEFLRETEFDLALHIICDFLLEPHSPPPSQELVTKLQFLHCKMEIVDDCVARLRQKITL
jgi:hypothetical protein